MKHMMPLITAAIALSAATANAEPANSFFKLGGRSPNHTIVSLVKRLPHYSLLAGTEIKFTLAESFGPNSWSAQISSTTNCHLTEQIWMIATLIQRWTRNTILPSKLGIGIEKTRNAVTTALRTRPSVPDFAYGLKNVRRILYGFIRTGYPRPNPLRTEATAGPDREAKEGIAWQAVRSSVRPTLEVAREFDDTTSPRRGQIDVWPVAHEPSPLRYNFVVWSRNDEPLTELEIAHVAGGSNGAALIVQGQPFVGLPDVDATEGSGGRISDRRLSCLVSVPVIRMQQALLRVRFRPTRFPYAVRFSILGVNVIDCHAVSNLADSATQEGGR